ncbi:hypothetical protein, variant 2 [Aphanomyces invadans]|uniref:CBS domain-containing protein n=1 Tax=Aphanomyces invadans TaxID=157072 RepID=A0A024UAV6_9STRA|nr:hypothetical protein, variant 2 [Aphanomyces invadans]ETW03546.1 hypothetical protein, variant 2 [Aphanomyces invadans]|eukprot:XP_008867775.1 hypothetical protein, variant 2 [Aphanomyces invadans]
MGATLSSHGLADEHLRPLVTEYTTQSLKTVEECWKIYVDEANSSRALTQNEFDEVFGMLLQDTVPHYALFETVVHGKTGVNGFEVLVAICLALRNVDIKRKLFFIFRMYVCPNHENFIETSARLVIYKDCVGAVTRMLRLSEPPSTEVTSAMEGALRAQDDSKQFVTLKEAIEFSLTHPFVCSFLEELQALFTGLVTVDKALTFFSNAELLLDDDIAASGVAAESFHDPSVLWATKIRDVGGQTWYNHDVVHMPDDLQCFLALKELQLRKQPMALVYERNRLNKTGDRVYCGLLDFETIVRCLLEVLPALDVTCKSTGSYMVNMSKAPDIELVKMEAEIADAGRKFASMPLRDVLLLARKSNEFVGDGTPPHGLRMAYGDDVLFNLVHRFAMYEFFVPIAHSPKHPSPIVGVLSPFDVVRFMLEDLTMLNGKQNWSVANVGCIFKPLSMHRATASIWQDIVELVESWPSKLHFVATVDFPVTLPAEITPTVSLPHFSNLVFPIVHVLKTKPPTTIHSNTSVAKALQTFYTQRLTRLYVVDDGQPHIGVVRLVDMMRLLLQEQKHTRQQDPPV